jgi:hypothetical protein
VSRNEYIKKNKLDLPILEKKGSITSDVKTSDILIRYAKSSIVSTSMSLMADMLKVIMKSQKSPALKDMWAVDQKCCVIKKVRIRKLEAIQQ